MTPLTFFFYGMALAATVAMIGGAGLLVWTAYCVLRGWASR